MAAKTAGLKPVMPKSAFSAPKSNARIQRRNSASTTAVTSKGAKLGKKR